MNFDTSLLSSRFVDPLHYDCWSELFVRFIVRSGLFWGLLQNNALFQVGFPGRFFSLFIAPLVQGTPH